LKAGTKEREGVNVTSDEPVLVADGLSKSYDGDTALQDLSFELRRGRVMGFLGPNGAGKTTSIRILTTIMRPTKGRFVIDGIDSDHPSAIRPRIGVLPETLGLPNQVTGLEYISYFSRLYGWKRSEAKTHGRELLDLVGLRAKAGKLIRTYSHGMRQRLGIARARVNDPFVLFLDEPVLGLDPRGQEDLLQLLRDIAAQRTAGIILSSHSLSDVERACDDAVILSSGRVVASGTISEVLTHARDQGPSPKGLRLRIPAAVMDRASAALQGMGIVESVAPVIDGRLRVVVDGTDGSNHDGTATNQVLKRLIDADVPVLGLDIEGSRLADVFMELTEEGSG
jgi:ABC-2 type transport system ATP-binding protein